jgi:hypothetical protein
MDESALAFGWSKWPFRIVADEEFAHVWADRSELRSELERRIRRLKSIPHSTVQMIWADFGAGKTHTLRRIEVQCHDDQVRALIPVYTEIPVGTDGLLDLYRRLVAALPEALVHEVASTLRNSVRRVAPTAAARDLRQALKLVGSEDPTSERVALEWLYASPGLPNLKLLKSYGIGARIETDIGAVEVIAELIRLVRELKPDCAVVWLIDEFQRVADVPLRKREAFAKSVVSLFNSCPSGLHFVLSFSVAQQSTAMALIPPDLQSRAATFSMLTLPHMTREDCLTFSTDLFDAFRTGVASDQHFPFTRDSLEYLVDYVADGSDGECSVRVVRHASGFYAPSNRPRFDDRDAHADSEPRVRSRTPKYPVATSKASRKLVAELPLDCKFGKYSARAQSVAVIEVMLADVAVAARTVLADPVQLLTLPHLCNAVARALPELPDVSRVLVDGCVMEHVKLGALVRLNTLNREFETYGAIYWHESHGDVVQSLSEIYCRLKEEMVLTCEQAQRAVTRSVGERKTNVQILMNALICRGVATTDGLAGLSIDSIRLPHVAS